MSMLDDVKDLPHGKWGELLNKNARNSIRQAVHGTRSFIFDSEASAKVGYFTRTCPDILADQVEFAIPPYDRTYIEIDVWAYLETLGTLDPRANRYTADARLGFLTIGPDIFVLANSIEKPIGWVSPLGLVRIPDLGPDVVHATPTGDMRDRYDITYEHTKQILLGTSYLSLTPAQRNRFANYFGVSYWGEPGDQNYYTSKFIQQCYGEARTYVACLLMLYQRKHIVLQDHGPRRGLAKGKARVYMAHTTVNISLGDEVTIRRAFRSSARAEARRHEVRTHYGHRHTDFHCDHDWQDHPGGVHKQWLCTKCGGLRFLRKAFLRGNGALGFVTKSYKVTS